MERVVQETQDGCSRLRLSIGVTNALTTRMLCDLASEAFAESKRMRLGKFCADLREQMSARVARQVEIWHSEEAQTRLRAAAKRLTR